MAACKAFMMKTIDEALEHWGEGWESIEEYGDTAYNHPLHTWDEGQRKLRRCNSCGGYILCQWSEFHSFSDDSDGYYTDFFPVEGPVEADEMNYKYDGFQIESVHHQRTVPLGGTAGRLRGASGSISCEYKAPAIAGS